jgi:hypothetical protein
MQKAHEAYYFVSLCCSAVELTFGIIKNNRIRALKNKYQLMNVTTQVEPGF